MNMRTISNPQSFKSSIQLEEGERKKLIEGKIGLFTCYKTWMYVCMCFPNWTGIVAEVKRGQLKRERDRGVRRKSWQGVQGGALGETEVPYFKDGAGQPRSHTTATNAHTPHSHTVALLPLMR